MKLRKNPVKILVSNDDGIDSLGIYELVKALKNIGDVMVVAPLLEQSAAGHAITMQNPLRVIKYYKDGEFFGHAVDGTPADCVKMGIRHILKERPDVVVSGINHGSNTATNVIYSGTVSAAREAALMDLPSLAVSITSREAKNLKMAGKVAARVTKLLMDNEVTIGTHLNVNIPDVPEDQLAGIKVTKQGNSKWDDLYERRYDPAGRDYYWLTGKLVDLDDEPDRDQHAIMNNYVSITPIKFDLTDYDTYDKMIKWNIDDLMNEEIL